VIALAHALGVEADGLTFGPNPRDRTARVRLPRRRRPALFSVPIRWQVAYVFVRGDAPPAPREPGWVADYESPAAAFLTALRLTAGLTETELARQCGMSIAEISRLEHGKRVVSDLIVARVAPALGVPRATFRYVYNALLTLASERERRAAMKRAETKSGQMYARTPAGELEEVPNYLEPDVVLCRRVADFPNQQAPAGATLGTCRTCEAVIAFNPAKFPDKPHVCMQCAGIEPLPMEQPQ